ncbi:cupin domain-containing protein [Mesorhizobium yinganensis]|uniref:cupin domain-containing protein n=1 Tax=Mesorhizobium yinganensis TaxID=3157707 RepID=UPI0032B79AD5
MLKILLTALALALLPAAALAQDAPAAIKRTPPQSVDFPDGHETLLGVTDVPPGAQSSPNSHPGLETGYVLDGEVTITVAGKADIVLKAGESYTISAGTVHSVKTVGDKAAKIITTYVIERGKPLSTPAP